jgi:spore coat protein A
MSFRRQITRRQFLKGAAVAGAAATLPMKFGVRSAWALGNSPKLTKWLQPLRGLTTTGAANAIPVAQGIPDPVWANTTMYQVAAGEFQDQLHPALGPTTLWGYYDDNPASPNYLKKAHLGGLIVATRGQGVRLRMRNTLPASSIMPVDTTVPGANQAVNRIAIHLHGGEDIWISDGGPHHWYTPANGTNNGWQGGTGLSFIQGPDGDPRGGFTLNNIPTMPMAYGQADYYYTNDQSTRLMWYHDHAHGITRTNAYAGLATAYLMVDPAQESALGGLVPPLASAIPLVFQDKKFVDPLALIVTDPSWFTIMPARVQTLGSLWYEHIYDPKEFRLLKSKKMLPLPNPSAIPEFFGDTMLTNGTVYPLVTLPEGQYRFLMLNACNARFLNLNLLEVAPNAEIVTDPKTLFAAAGTLPGPNMVQIGSEGGYLLNSVTFAGAVPFNPATLTGQLLLGNAERADVIIDFKGQAGKEFILYNDAPGPFPAGPPTTDYFLGNPKNPVQPLAGTGPDTRQILRFKITGPASTAPPLNTTAIDAVLVGATFQVPPLPFPPVSTVAPIPPITVPNTVFRRQLTLNEAFDLYGRLQQLLGTTAPQAAGGFGIDYLAAPTENITIGTPEVWEIFNLTADTHPIHFHLNNCQILSRQPFKVVNGVFTPTGLARGPQPNEVGWKETVQMHPGEVTRVYFPWTMPTAPFAYPNSPRTGGKEYVWHCHILEHEEHDMMRPLIANP